jgi:hypothetical protein
VADGTEAGLIREHTVKVVYADAIRCSQVLVTLPPGIVPCPLSALFDMVVMIIRPPLRPIRLSAFKAVVGQAGRGSPVFTELVHWAMDIASGTAFHAVHHLMATAMHL